MLPLALLAVTAAATAGVVMTLQKPGTVYPFAPVKPSAADTLAADAETVFADDGWSVVTLNRLSDVEDLLDSLEAHQVVEREVRVMGNSSFRVRWK
jgi:hypothetical protein